LLRRSIHDLEQYRREVSHLESSRRLLPRGIKQIYAYHWISAETWLQRGALDRERGDEPSHRDALLQAKRAFDLLDAFGTEHSLKAPSDFEALRQRIMDGLREGHSSRR
jgi:hypothetical protein